MKSKMKSKIQNKQTPNMSYFTMEYKEVLQGIKDEILHMEVRGIKCEINVLNWILKYRMAVDLFYGREVKFFGEVVDPRDDFAVILIMNLDRFRVIFKLCKVKEWFNIDDNDFVFSGDEKCQLTKEEEDVLLNLYFVYLIFLY